MTYKQFIFTVIKKCFETNPPDSFKGRPSTTSLLRKTGQHFPDLYVKDGKTKYSDYVLCKLSNKRMQTKFRCETCNVS